MPPPSPLLIGGLVGHKTGHDDGERQLFVFVHVVGVVCAWIVDC